MSFRSCVFWLSGLLTILSVAAGGTFASDPTKIVGPNACAECHKQEAEAWKGTHHFKTFREMPRRKEATEIAERMGVQRIRSDSLCLGCHYTVEQKDDKKQPVAGISCESCHSGGEDWIKVHSGFSGKTEKTESKAEAEARWKLAESKGMIRPSSLYRLAKNCYSCHVVPQEELVNKGGHAAGSAFELVSWSLGEVRHNTWHSKGKENVPASAARKRMLYLVGPRCRARDGVARGRQGDGETNLCVRDGQARRQGTQAARRRGESSAERAGDREDGRIRPLRRLKAQQ